MECVVVDDVTQMPVLRPNVGIEHDIPELGNMQSPNRCDFRIAVGGNVEPFKYAATYLLLNEFVHQQDGGLSVVAGRHFSAISFKTCCDAS